MLSGLSLMDRSQLKWTRLKSESPPWFVYLSLLQRCSPLQLSSTCAAFHMRVKSVWVSDFRHLGWKNTQIYIYTYFSSLFLVSKEWRTKHSGSSFSFLTAADRHFHRLRGQTLYQLSLINVNYVSNWITGKKSKLGWSFVRRDAPLCSITECFCSSNRVIRLRS